MVSDTTVRVVEDRDRYDVEEEKVEEMNEPLHEECREVGGLRSLPRRKRRRRRGWRVCSRTAISLMIMYVDKQCSLDPSNAVYAMLPSCIPSPSKRSSMSGC